MPARRKVSVAERRARLALRHRLAPSTRTDDVASIADSLVALHSSDPVSVYLSAFVRMAHPAVDAVDHELYESRRVIRFHAMRRTLWVATPEVAREAHASSTTKLLGPEHQRFVKCSPRTTSATTATRGSRAAKTETLAALHELGQATTRQLGDQVPALRTADRAGAGKVLLRDAAGSRAGAAASELRGRDRPRPTDRVVDQLAVPMGGHGRLGPRRHRRHGPACGVGRAGDQMAAHVRAGHHGRRAVVDGMERPRHRTSTRRAGAVEVDIEAPGGVETAWLAPDDVDPVSSRARWVALLPGLDPTTMGWKERQWFLDRRRRAHDCSTATATPVRRYGSTGASSVDGSNGGTGRSPSAGSARCRPPDVGRSRLLPTGSKRSSATPASPSGSPPPCRPSCWGERRVFLVDKYSVPSILTWWPGRNPRSNPLALAVLACLLERPMHPYEVSQTLEVAPSTRASASTTARSTAWSRGWSGGSSSTPGRRCARAGGPSGRSTRSPTPACVELTDWLSDLVATPAKEYLQFEAALSFLAALPPDEALGAAPRALRQRLELRLAQHPACGRPRERPGLPRLFMLESSTSRRCSGPSSSSSHAPREGHRVGRARRPRRAGAAGRHR